MKKNDDKDKKSALHKALLNFGPSDKDIFEKDSEKFSGPSFDAGIKARLDLHGMNQIEAELAVERFVSNCFFESKSPVLIITGIGIHSNSKPVLSELTKSLLNKNRFIRSYSHKKKLGGKGSILVYLKNRKNK